MYTPTTQMNSRRKKQRSDSVVNKLTHSFLLQMQSSKEKIRNKHGNRVPDKNMRRRQSTLQMFVAEPSETMRNLFWAAENGDTPSIEALLTQRQSSIDADAADAFGRTAIQIAVVNEHAEIVELLLDWSNPVNLYEALLLAISHNYENITELILKHPTYRQYHYRWPELAAKLPETSSFSDDVSPIVLACQKNLFGIVHLLWREGMRVPLPHDFDCNCERCLPEGGDIKDRDQLKHAKRRLNEYRALTSEAYISLTAPDPFQTAFELSRQMEKRATQEKHFKREYKELFTQLCGYVVKLLDNVRTHYELQTILNCCGNNQKDVDEQEPSMSFSTQPSRSMIGTRYEPLSRLRLAIKYKQMEFVSHWSCQQELMRIWLRGFKQHHGTSGHSKILIQVLLIIFFYPILSVFHWVIPDSKVGQVISRPLVKFVAYSVSYLAFLGILSFITMNPYSFYESPVYLSKVSVGQYTLNDTLQAHCAALCGSCMPTSSKNVPVVEGVGRLTEAGVVQVCSFHKDFIMRPCKDNWLSWLATIWLVGFLCRKLFEAVTRDIPDVFFHQRWSSTKLSPFDYIDFVVLAVFATAFLLRFSSYSRTAGAVEYFFETPVNSSYLGDVQNHLYWINVDRCYFDPLDPLTCCELLFAIGAVFSFSRLLYIFPVLEVFGPCYLALMRVVNDISAIVLMYMVVLGAFMMGTMNVYWYFKPTLRQAFQLNSTYNPPIPAELRFGNLELTFRTAFWSLFGLGESDYMNLQNYGNGTMILVERIGYIMYGGYCVVVVIGILNTLIAMMANSYEAIKKNSETEWKYARTILFLEYIPDYTPTVPMPFNLIPNPRYLLKAVQMLLRKIRLAKFQKLNQHGAGGTTHGGGDEEASNDKPSLARTVSSSQKPSEEDDEGRKLNIGAFVTQVEDTRTQCLPVPLGFNDVLHKILRRFILGLTIRGSAGTVDLEEIKQDISSFRFELLNILSNENAGISKSNDSLAVHKQLQGSGSTEQAPMSRSAYRSPMLRRTIAPYRRRNLLSGVNDAIMTESSQSNSETDFRKRSNSDKLTTPCSNRRRYLPKGSGSVASLQEVEGNQVPVDTESVEEEGEDDTIRYEATTMI